MLLRVPIFLAEAEATVIKSGQKQSVKTMEQTSLVDTYELGVDRQTWKFLFFVFLERMVWRKSPTMLGGGKEETPRYENPPRPLVGTASMHEYNMDSGGHGSPIEGGTKWSRS
jgi:hypothetical protein